MHNSKLYDTYLYLSLHLSQITINLSISRVNRSDNFATRFKFKYTYFLVLRQSDLQFVERRRLFRN